MTVWPSRVCGRAARACTDTAITCCRLSPCSALALAAPPPTASRNRPQFASTASLAAPPATLPCLLSPARSRGAKPHPGFLCLTPPWARLLQPALPALLIRQENSVLHPPAGALSEVRSGSRLGRWPVGPYGIQPALLSPLPRGRDGGRVPSRPPSHHSVLRSPLGCRHP